MPATPAPKQSGIALVVGAGDSTGGAIAKRFAKVAADMAANEAKINQELLDAQGKPVDIGGYYRPDPVKTAKAMCPSATLNAIIEAM